MNILAKIVESKKREIGVLYERYDLRALSEEMTSSQPILSPIPLFYQRLTATRAAGKPFFITEFKRKSPSEGWINQHADFPSQIQLYTQAGASAISILTDEPFFGGTYDDLKRARSIVNSQPATIHSPLLLQKDFILDPLQIYLAKLHGADLILLIAAILEPGQLDELRKTAESIGMGVLVEVHDAAELEKIQHLDFQVLGINNRDLKTFRTSLNRVNVLKQLAGERFVIAESGVLDDRHFQMVKNADGFLIGTGLMRNAQSNRSFRLTDHFQSQGRFLFKACGIRTVETLRGLTTSFAIVGVLANNNDRAQSHAKSEGLPSDMYPVSADFIGINFSPLSKRQADAQTCAVLKTSQVSGELAVFYKNTESEIRETLENYPFKTIQLYAADVSPGFVRSLKVRVILAVKVSDRLPWMETMTSLIEPYAADVDCFILDGTNPGSGERISAEIPADFPYPFLLAGGLQVNNLEAILAYKNCIGVDIASGIETEGEVDLKKIEHIAQRLAALSLPHDFSNRL